MTVARCAAAALLAVVVVAIAIVLLGGGGDHTYRLRFTNAGQLVKDDDVQIGGRRVGSVQSIRLTNDNQAEIRISLQDAYAPLHRGTTAVIRATSLSGIANRYIALTPGPQSAPELDDGALLTAERSQAPVDLDQLFDSLDPRARKGLQQVIDGSSTWYDGQGANANKGSKYFNPALSTTAALVNELVRDQSAFQDLVTHSSRVVTALAARAPQLTDLVSNTSTTAGAIASENRSLSQGLDLLPGTLRKANTTFVNLRATLDDLDRLVSASKPATKDLAPLLRRLRPLVASARPTIADLRRLVRKPGAGNDLIELLRKAPGLERIAKPTFAHSIQAFRKSTPVLSFIRPYTPELVGWFRDFGEGTANYDANGHFARIQPIFNLFDIDDNTATINPKAGLQGFEFDQLQRCPGGETQPTTDKSSPFRDSSGTLDCDPSQVPPGP
jgi:phospholipid/cholesterol/gamma-HCH transport system substrate-binding protein